MTQHKKIEISKFYNKDYAERQILTQKISGLADTKKFESFVSAKNKKILDFGAGPGNIILNLECLEKSAVEPNEIHHENLRKNKVIVYKSTAEACEKLSENYFDIIVSNHCLEHVLDPISEIRNLYKLLKPGGLILLFVPFEGLQTAYISDDENNHLYTWSPRNLGNLFREAENWKTIRTDSYLPKWPPYYWILYNLGWNIFHILCCIYGFFSRSPSQVYILASK